MNSSASSDSSDMPVNRDLSTLKNAAPTGPPVPQTQRRVIQDVSHEELARRDLGFLPRKVAFASRGLRWLSTKVR